MPAAKSAPTRTCSTLFAPNTRPARRRMTGTRVAARTGWGALPTVRDRRRRVRMSMITDRNYRNPATLTTAGDIDLASRLVDEHVAKSGPAGEEGSWTAGVTPG